MNEKKSLDPVRKTSKNGETSVCGSQRFYNIFSHDRYGLWHPTVLCKQCGLIQSNHRLTESSYKSFYESDEYRRLYVGNEDFLLQEEKRYEDGCRNQRYLFESLHPVLKERNLTTILEIGCGGGWNLFPFMENGYTITGYEYSQTLVKMGKSKGLNLMEGSLPEIIADNKTYDVIILNHVMEHFTDFFGSMKTILSHLNHRGILYAGVPNIDNFGIGQFQNAHVYYFSPRTFKYYMEVCGLKLINYGPAQRIHMYSIFEIYPDEIDMKALSQEYGIMLQKIRLSKTRHFMGSILERMGVKKTAKSFLQRYKAVQR